MKNAQRHYELIEAAQIKQMLQDTRFKLQVGDKIKFYNTNALRTGVVEKIWLPVYSSSLAYNISCEELGRTGKNCIVLRGETAILSKDISN